MNSGYQVLIHLNAFFFGLLLIICLYSRVNDIITQVNDVNVENVMHAEAVQALKDSGNSARLVSSALIYLFYSGF